MPLDGSRSKNYCKSYCLCWCRHIFFFRRLLTDSTTCLIHQSTRNSMPIAAIVWDWRNSWRSFRKAILGEEVSCFLATIAFPFTCCIRMTSNRLYQIVQASIHSEFYLVCRDIRFCTRIIFYSKHVTTRQLSFIDFQRLSLFLDHFSINASQNFNVNTFT